jgi:hypothetical protein
VRAVGRATARQCSLIRRSGRGTSARGGGAAKRSDHASDRRPACWPVGLAAIMQLPNHVAVVFLLVPI